MSDNTNKSNLVDLCGNGCCPKVDFSEPDKITITDNGQIIVLKKSEAVNLARELLERGYLD